MRTLVLVLQVLAGALVCSAQAQTTQSTYIGTWPGWYGRGYGYGVAQPDSQTTRIETRPIYGATVTFEHGVRVWRPIPPTTNLIIDPGPLVRGYPR
jgi:hypothetical protein